jgi:hypothetical protein
VSAPLANTAEATLRELESATNSPRLSGLSGHQLLMERAHLSGLCFQDGQSAGGTCRLLDTADQPIALNLPRPSDWDLMPAWLEIDVDTPGCWQRLAAELKDRDSATLIERARLLGLAVASAAPRLRISAPTEHPRQSGGPRDCRPTVIDLSALWAGPLCGHLLHLCGAEVIKVESIHRPDGARFGNASFYGLLNQGKDCVALDFRHPHGQRQLKDLLRSADIVIEASRPRALRQLGIDVDVLLKERPDLTWVSITGYGRDEPQAQWIAFGDDAGVAGGLSEVMRRATGRYQFVGDAIADPLTGIRAAWVAWRSWLMGGGQLIPLALADVAADCLAEELKTSGATAVERAFAGWWSDARRNGAHSDVRARPIVDRVAKLGEHTDRVLRQRGIRC